MSRLYTLTPLPIDDFAGLDLTARCTFGMIYDRYRLSSYNLTGGDSVWYDWQRGETYCIFTHEELARELGISERTVRRALEALKAANVLDWRKATYKGANRYYIPEHIRMLLRAQ